ncbi:3-phosphoserine/phosphohydroxythreonine transaminase [Xenorhabdus sp. 18]|nr:3-phosphoserine/phosphohydroxythreonine transaminase [Xenorhabdus sp. 18]
MFRSYNFSAGPAMLPIEVLEEAHEEFFDFSGTGMSVMELSHRSEIFLELAQKAELMLRKILNIPDHYKVLFLQGGSSLQFSQVPMNLLRGKNTADYVHTGLWSGNAINAAKKFCNVKIACSSESLGFNCIPKPTNWILNPDAAYLHYTENETVHGVQFSTTPTSSVPLVCDACSSLLSKPINVAKHGLIYASAQKNIGLAGVTIVIVDKELLGASLDITPDILDYTDLARAGSMLNTPATFSWYLTGLMLKWIDRFGGIENIHKINKEKAKLLYNTIDNSDYFYVNNVEREFRSINNIPFVLANASLEKEFLQQADQAGFKGLKGHSSVGGIRASIYNAVTFSAVEALADFMKYFQKING